MKKNRIFILLATSIMVLSACQQPTSQNESTESAPMVTETSSSAVADQPTPDNSGKSEAPAVEIDFLNNFEETKLASYFDGFDHAAFIITDGTEPIIYNSELANTPLSPYSTFKIPNSMIALETAVIDHNDSTKKWDGTVNSREVVNQDHNLDSAFENSVVWYYQELARDIGEDKMKEYLARMNYGNQDISGGIDQFWLGSSLEITPLEQLEFIKNTYENTFGFSKSTVDTMKKIMKEKNTDFDLYGKSGSSIDQASWYVGYLEIKDKTYFFVTYMEDKDIHAKQYTIDLFRTFLAPVN